MKTIKTTLIGVFLCTIFSYGQTVQEIINQVDLANLTLTLNEFSGEQSTIVNGSTVTILNRQQANNDLAADYLVERFEALDNVTVTDQSFNTNGRNIYATQEGKTNPDNIYIICAHYDSVADFCADDNVSGVAAILEIARILSTQCLDNTIVYALWDEEEIGLRGSRDYAIDAVNNNDNIIGVYNIDMMAYDGDGDNSFDIDVRQGDTASINMGNEINTVLNSYTFNLNANIINPGTELSDHSSFWNRGFPAVLVGEAWSEGDENDQYHTTGDVVSNLDLPFYLEMVKLSAAYMATKASLVAIDNTLTVTSTSITSNQSSASYQWYDCDTNLAISGATNQTFMPSSNGSYAVEVSSGNCTERSGCLFFNTLGFDTFLEEDISIYPNPVTSYLNIGLSDDMSDLDINLYDISGKLIYNLRTSESLTTLNLKAFPQGIYFLNISSSEKTGTYKIVKE
ncbi:M28 family peptidase [Psychroserpens algicola]|uniref:M28 family peptidase n=1 Tax=Psychroserpens algicola TaxID=1719034 RepID=A0ABT0H4Q0_9FLAO|nr:M28 family peptidase [Psychroserpens algicola]MCK8479358.1 M28 family peptidase [Psychroserpens algicola]